MTEAEHWMRFACQMVDENVTQLSCDYDLCKRIGHAAVMLTWEGLSTTIWTFRDQSRLISGMSRLEAIP